MPWMQATLELANEKLNSQHIGDHNPEAFSPGKNLAELTVALGIDLDERAINHLRIWPESVTAALGATLQNAIGRSKGGEAIPIQLTWTPAIGFGASIWEVSGIGGSPTAITVQLQSPVPREAGTTD